MTLVIDESDYVSIELLCHALFWATQNLSSDPSL